MKILAVITLTCAISNLSGCASNPPIPYQYKNTDSKALNYVKAAGMSAKLEDMVAPKDTVNNITDTSGFALALSASGYHSPVPGFTSSGMASLNLASWFLLPKAAASRNSLFAWMPYELSPGDPEGAVKVLADLLFDAGMSAAREMGFTPVGVQDDDRKNNVVSFRDVQGIDSCQNKEVYATCLVNFAVRKPVYINETPDFISYKQQAWFFDPNDEYLNSFFAFPRHNKGINELEYLIITSRLLPEWIFLYLAPKQVWVNTDDKIRVPMVLNQGRVNYFVKPDS